MKTKRTASATLMFREGILVIEFPEKVEISAREAFEHIEVAAQLTGGKACPVIIIDHHPNTRISPEARDILSKSDIGLTRLSEAYVSAYLAKRNMALIYVKYQVPNNPAQVFSNFNDAWNWSAEFIKK